MHFLLKNCFRALILQLIIIMSGCCTGNDGKEIFSPEQNRVLELLIKMQQSKNPKEQEEWAKQFIDARVYFHNRGERRFIVFIQPMDKARNPLSWDAGDIDRIATVFITQLGHSPRTVPDMEIEMLSPNVSRTLSFLIY
jgi:hypothetical protein